MHFLLKLCPGVHNLSTEYGCVFSALSMIKYEELIESKGKVLLICLDIQVTSVKGPQQCIRSEFGRREPREMQAACLPGSLTL